MASNCCAYIFPSTALMLLVYCTLTVYICHMDYFHQEQFESKTMLTELFKLLHHYQSSSSTSSPSKAVPPDSKHSGLLTSTQCPSKAVQESLDQVMATQKSFTTDLERLKSKCSTTGCPLQSAKATRNFALESLNADIVTIGDTKMLDSDYYFYIFNWLEIPIHRRVPQLVLNPSNQPGQCFAFKPVGDATIVIRLMDKVHVESVSLVHITAAESPTGKVDSAPKEFSVYGLDHIDQKKPFLFGKFRYDLDDQRPAQTFKFDIKSTKAFQLVKFVIHSNHGNDRMTCLYQVMVHGILDAK
jgi:Sad1 / UNC-like C-terminal